MNLVQDAGPAAIEEFHRVFPKLSCTTYYVDNLAVPEWLNEVDLALVHEWNDPRLISAIGNYAKRNPEIRLLFHDTHHRAVTAAHELARFDLTAYHGILVYGHSLRTAYERRGWGKQVHVWHEAADVRTFYPRGSKQKSGDVVWIGNWGDEERSEELREYFIDPVKRSGLRAEAYGVRYPDAALQKLTAASIQYGGWVPNFKVPEIFSRFKATVHIPRRPYTQALPGIPTIRPFEALACGIPLISAPWQDTEGLFRSGRDFLMARNGFEMEKHLGDVLNDPSLAQSLSASGLETVRSRHTCAHRVDELLDIWETIQPAMSEAVEVHQ
ncbi:MAG: glycosyltransferase [Acidobacteriaceae bacterium]|nr:glycosyltransferase [Acidobacteriaceae bacterium]MBV9780644.1 glycosyltransferase [Acidobacteriaceae bacterium]